MTRAEFLDYCLNNYKTRPDFPFENDFETAVLRHYHNRKWYAIAMKVSRRKFGFDSDESTDVVNLKVPTEFFCFDSGNGVFPAYHMNKRHWVSVLLNDASADTVKFLLSLSYEATQGKKR